MRSLTTVTLPGSSREYEISIPKRNLGEILSPAAVPAQFELSALVERALADPIGCPPLSETVCAGQSILIVVDDITRATPTDKIVPHLLEYLSTLGCREEDIALALALGTHRPMTDPEIEVKLGRDVARRFKVINTPAQEQGAFVDTGESWGGVPIEVHRAVIDADIVIGVGSVVPHADAGWSGGCKIILPGMCSERTVMENHFLAAFFPSNLLGREVTSIRENMEGVVEKIGLDYILNVVMTPHGDVIDVKGGHFVAAQRAAMRAARDIFSVPFSNRVDIAVSNAYPAECDYWQASKGIWAGDLMVKPGGTVILNAPCPEGIGPHPEFMYWTGIDAQEIIDAVETGRLADKTVAGGAVEIAHILEHIQLIIVSEGLSASEVNANGFAHFASLQEAVDAHLAEADPDSKVGIITHGGYTYPILEETK